jgi:hypothetical protein
MPHAKRKLAEFPFCISVVDVRMAVTNEMVSPFLSLAPRRSSPTPPLFEYARKFGDIFKQFCGDVLGDRLALHELTL